MRGTLRALRCSQLFAVTAIVLACAHFCSQVELFEEEYEAAHPFPSAVSTVSAFSITWETFDKDNASPAFVVDVNLRTDRPLFIDAEAAPAFIAPPDQHPVRDKSPPLG